MEWGLCRERTCTLLRAPHEEESGRNGEELGALEQLRLATLPPGRFDDRWRATPRLVLDPTLGQRERKPTARICIGIRSPLAAPVAPTTKVHRPAAAVEVE